MAATIAGTPSPPHRTRRPRRADADREREDATSRLLKMMCDTNRRRMMRAIDGRKTVTELKAEIGITQPLLSYDMSLLRLNGLVERRRDGRYNRYALTPVGRRLLGLIGEFER